jgi:tetratricopeptide (TPR) repeat protein
MSSLKMLSMGVLSVAAISSPAWGQADDEVQRAMALHKGGNVASAFAVLSAVESSRAGDPEFDYALGLVAVDAGQRGRAIIALQRVLSVQPGNAQARAEIARAYALSGDIDTARAEFNTVINDPSIPDPVRQRFDQLVRGYDQQIAGGAARATGFVDIEGGYDSNINAATNLTTIALPAFSFLGAATLGGTARRIDAGFGQIQGGVSGDVGMRRQTKAYVSLLGLYRDAFAGRSFDQAALTGTGGIAYTAANRNVVSLSGQVQQFWLARSAYRTSCGAIAQYTAALKGGRALSIAGQYSFLDYKTDKLRNADRYGLTVTYADRTYSLSAGGGREATRKAAGRHLGYSYAQAAAAYEVPLSARIALTGSLGIEHRNYRDTDPLFLAGRLDTQIDASLGLRFVVARGISLRPRVSYTRNDSNLALYKYERVTASLSLRGEF